MGGGGGDEAGGQKPDGLSLNKYKHLLPRWDRNMNSHGKTQDLLPAHPFLGSFWKCVQSLNQEVMKDTGPGADTADYFPTSTEYNTPLRVPNYTDQLVNPYHLSACEAEPYEKFLISLLVLEKFPVLTIFPFSLCQTI